MDCQPAYQIEHSLKRPSEVFDWLVTPHQALLDIIKEDGERLALNFAVAENGTTVVCRNYGVLYHHEFEREADGRIVFSIAACENAHSKLRHKMDNFTKICTSKDRVLFIRRRTQTTAPGDSMKGEMVTSRHVNEIVEVISARYPDLDFGLVYVTTDRDDDKHDFSDPLHSRIKIEHVPCGTGEYRIGPDEDWEVIFKKFGLEA